MNIDFATKILGLVAAIIGLFTAGISLKISLNTQGKLKSVDERLQIISSSMMPKCIEGPTYTDGYVNVRITQAPGDWWFVAVSQNKPDSVWIQRMDRPDMEGRLRLEAYGFNGRYAVYGACDDTTITRFRELQAQSAKGQAVTLHDLPNGAFLICVNDT